jgi:DNA-binding transcriptional ArsR family regulator
VWAYYLQPQLVELVVPQQDVFSDAAQHDACSLAEQQAEPLLAPGVVFSCLSVGMSVGMVCLLYVSWSGRRERSHGETGDWRKRRNFMCISLFTRRCQSESHNIQEVEYDPAMNETSTEQQARLFRALMHPARLAILEALRGGEQCVCHLEARLGYRQAYLSQQLAVLREAGLVRDHREGWNVYYLVAQPDVFTLLDTARAMVGGAPAPATLPTRLADCPCSKCAAVADPLPGQ